MPETRSTAGSTAQSKAADVAPDPLLPARSGEALVREVMIGAPTTHRADLTVAEAREALARPKLHMVLLVEQHNAGQRLVGALVDGDIPDTADDADLAAGYAVTIGRTVTAEARLAEVWDALHRAGGRRLAVVDDQSGLLGLVCLKRSRAGFCTDAGVAAWRRERAENAR